MKKSRGKIKYLSDEELWKRFKNGDDLAFEYIYEIYFDRLYSYGCQFTADTELVEDTLHDLFLELRRRSFHLSKTDKILPYLFVAFKRKLIRSRDKANRHVELGASDNFSIQLSIEAAIIEKEDQAEYLSKMNEAIEQLSVRHREMIYLFYYENLSYDEIKEIQGFEDVKSARNLLYKAIKSLRKLVQLLILYLSGGF